MSVSTHLMVKYLSWTLVNGKVYQLSDCSLFKSERWPDILDTVWKSQSYQSLGFITSKDIYENGLLGVLIHQPMKSSIYIQTLFMKAC